MAYCVKCGVEIAVGVTRCPLCETEVIMPDDTRQAGERLYPLSKEREREPYRPSLFGLTIYTVILAIPLFLTLLLDLKLNGAVTWSFYPVTSLVLWWVLTTIPFLFRTCRFAKSFTVMTMSIAVFLYLLNWHMGKVTWAWYPVSALALLWVYAGLPGFLLKGKSRAILAILADGAATAVYLQFMEVYTHSGTWFFSLALPLVGIATLLTLVIALLVVTGKLRDYAITSAVCVAMGIMSVGADLLVDCYVQQGNGIGWSLIALVVMFLLAVLFALVHKKVEIQVLLKKKFHI